MVQLLLRNNNGFRWYQKGGVYVKGRAFCDEAYLDSNDLLDYFNVKSEDEFRGKLVKISGNFVVVVKKKNHLMVAVDRVRGFPLFYYLDSQKNIILSDVAKEIRENIPQIEINERARIEFSLLGYVSEGETLFEGMQQLQASEYLSYRLPKKELIIRTYFNWEKDRNENKDRTELLRELDDIYLESFQKLIKLAGRKKLIVPLSGGLDSRLIVFMLKRMGCENVLCFSYGRQGNTESIISERIARKLGYDWAFIPYTNKKWRKAYFRANFAEYLDYAFNYTSTPVLQDWLAVSELKKNNIIPNNSVFVPGHTPMLTIQYNAVKKYYHDKEKGDQVFKAVLANCHYNLNKDANNDFEYLFNEKIKNYFRVNCQDEDCFTNYLDRWAWRERQSKFIINSVRSYEYWGYDWALPLWENDAINFFVNLPDSFKENKQLLRDYLSTYFKEFQIEEEVSLNNKNSIGFRLKTIINKYKLKQQLDWIRAYYKHPMAWYGINSVVRHIFIMFNKRSNIGSGFSINSIVSDMVSRNLLGKEGRFDKGFHKKNANHKKNLQ